jgi:hypothetical protein
LFAFFSFLNLFPSRFIARRLSHERKLAKYSVNERHENQ